MPTQLRTLAHVSRAFKQFPNAKITTLGEQEAKLLESVLRRRVQVGSSGRQTAIRTLVNLAESSSSSAMVFLKGGVPRDVVALEEPRDVDATYVGTDWRKVLKVYQDQFTTDLELTQFVPGMGLLGVGDGDDSFDIGALHMHQCSVDCLCNSLLIHASTKTLIDPWGSGAQDAREKVFRIPCDDRSAWATSVRQPLWRMLKFRLRGFTVPQDDLKFIYTHFVEGADTHDAVVWGDGASRVLQLDPLACSEIAINDINSLRSQGHVPFDSSVFFMLLLKHNTLQVRNTNPRPDTWFKRTNGAKNTKREPQTNAAQAKKAQNAQKAKKAKKANKAKKAQKAQKAN